MIKERPILFQGSMALATLDGSKTQTRRTANRLLNFGKITDLHLFGKRNDAVSFKYLGGVKYTGPIQDLLEMCPYGQRGDRLWGREAHKYADWTDDGLPFIQYRADGEKRLIERIPSDEWAESLHTIWERLSREENYSIDNTASDRVWRPSIHMPRWASRINLEITRVRVERLQDISEADAMAEGLKLLSKDGGRTYKYGITDRDGLPGTDDHGWPWKHFELSAKAAYRRLWESINGPGSWDANPLVWVVEFRNLEE